MVELLVLALLIAAPVKLVQRRMTRRQRRLNEAFDRARQFRSAGPAVRVSYARDVISQR